MQHTCKLAMAQMRMTDSIEENLQKSLNFCDEAADSDLLFFPEIQLSPFFPQYEKRNADQWCIQESAPELEALKEKAAEHKLYLSPNVYLEQKGKRYDTSLFITPEGQIADRTKMVHIAQTMQNQVFIAMCNRVGREGGMDFAGESLVVHPSGDVIVKADDQEQLIRCELNLGEAREWRDKVPYLGTRRPEWYL